MMQPQKILANKIPTADLQQLFEQATRLMHAYGQRVLTPEMLLYVWMQTDNEGLRSLVGEEWAEFEQAVQTAARHNHTPDVGLVYRAIDNSFDLPLGEGVITLLHEGYTLAQSRGEAGCGPVHILVFMCNPETNIGRLLARFDITASRIMALLGEGQTKGEGLFRDYVACFQADAQALPLYPRPDLLNQLTQALQVFGPNNVILVGPTGVGKRSLAYSLAQDLAMEAERRFKSLIEINEQAWLENTGRAWQVALRQARGGILFLPNIDRWFARYGQADGLEIQKALLDSAVTVLGTTTPERYQEYLAGNTIIAENSFPLPLAPARAVETEAILTTLRPHFEENYQHQIEADALPEVVRLAERYLSNLPLPGGAVHLLHRACAGAQGSLSIQRVRETVTALTGIPLQRPEAEERQRYARLPQILQTRIVGQTEAISAVSQAVQAGRLGLKDPRRPVGSFLFLGPTGVGKSETAKALAQFMFGAENALLTLDMSEYMDASAINRLIGSPPGYIGSQNGGQLTNALLNQPYQVILFDEVEKAAPQVFDLLLQILDEGRLTSGRGEIVSFSECLILLTSNLGQDETEPVEQALQGYFRPEFLNRLDGIIRFNALGEAELSQVLTRLLAEEGALLAEQKTRLAVSESAQGWLLAQNSRSDWGARPLRRLVQEHIRSPIVAFLLRQPPQTEISVTVDAGTDGLHFDFDTSV